MKRVLWGVLAACLLCSSIVSASHRNTVFQGDEDDYSINVCSVHPDDCD